MSVQPPELPPLPASWPFPKRDPRPSLILGHGLEIPGQGGGWTLLAEGSLEGALSFEPLHGAFGRGGVGRAGNLVIRPYRRGGLLRFVNDRTYASPRRFLSELHLHRALWEGGFPTVPPFGCAWRRRGWGVEGLYLSAFVPGRPWPRAWAAEAWPPVARAIAALADWGCWSPDLNATNVHLPEAGEPLLLDFDRAGFPGGDDLRVRYRARLLRSLVKLGAPGALRGRVAEGPW